MRIINTGNKKIKNVLIFCSLFIVHSSLSGCAQKPELKTPQGYSQKAEVYYHEAVKGYQGLIRNGKDSARLNLDLGKLYFTHGDFSRAAKAFQQSAADEAKKFLAITDYQLGDFVDAWQIFSKIDIKDDEYLYYAGLTAEKLNLFDRALEYYAKINTPEFKQKAKARIEIIQKEAGPARIKEISPEVAAILDAAPDEAKYPQAGALVLLADESSEVSPEGTEVSNLHYIVKILNERGKGEFSETSIDYDSTFEKVELEYARTVKPDGTVTDVGSRHIRDVSKYLNFPLYSNARVFIISFPEIAEGAVIEYKAKIYRSQLINKKDYVLAYPVQAGEPVIRARFKVSVPKDRPLQIKILNEKYNDFAAKLDPEKEEKDNQIIYRWNFSDIPQIIPESNMPAAVEINPSILLSTFNSWQDLYRWWHGLAKDKIQADAGIKDKVKELTRGLGSDEEKARAIYNFCAKDIRYVAVEYGDAGYEPHRAEDIFRNKYGDCKDKAILLVTMLKEAGLNACPVLIPTKEVYNLNPDFPSLLFNHAIAAVFLQGKIYFLDATAETCSFGDLPGGDQARRVLLCKEDNYAIEETPLYPAKHNLVRQDLKIKVNADETIAAQKSILTLGSYGQAQRYWLLYTPPQLIEETLKEKIQDVSIGARLEKYNIENADDLNKPVLLNYSFSGSEYFTNAGNLRILPQLSGFDTSMAAKDKRKYPIDFGILDGKETLLDIAIPPGFVVKYMPKSVVEESPWLNFSTEYSYRAGHVYFKEDVETRKDTVTQDEYPGFKKFVESLAKKLKERIVLEKIK